MERKSLLRQIPIVSQLLVALIILVLLFCNVTEVMGEHADSIRYNAKTYEDIKVLLHSGKPVLIAFGADYCPTCENYVPYIKELNNLYESEIIIKFVDTVENEEIRSVFNIELIPSTIFFASSGKAYRPSDSLEIAESERYDGEPRYVSETIRIIGGKDIGLNTAFEYGLEERGELAYCKYVGLIDMVHLKQIVDELLVD